MDASFYCHGWCHTRQGWGCAGDQQRHLRIAGGAQAQTVEAGAIHVIGMYDFVEPQLILKEISQ
jgi:hypothetical protein